LVGALLFKAARDSLHRLPAMRLLRCRQGFGAPSLHALAYFEAEHALGAVFVIERHAGDVGRGGLMDAATAGAICPHGQSCAIARTSPLDSCQDDSPQSSYIEKSGEIARVVRGVYYVPEKSRFLDTEVPA